MADTLTPDGKLGCQSCPADFPFPATHIAHPKLIDGNAGGDWPVCAMHMQLAMVAGWFPIDEIKSARTRDDAPDARPDVETIMAAIGSEAMRRPGEGLVFSYGQVERGIRAALAPKERSE